MAISSVVKKNIYTGTNLVSTYNYSFKVFVNTEIEVKVRLISTGVETSLVLTTDYTVTGVGAAAGGTIVLVNASQAWLTTGYLKDTYDIVIKRKRPLTQTTAVKNQGDYYPELHENQFDKLVMQDLQQQEELDRSFKVPVSIDPADFDPEFPATLVGSVSVSLVTNATGDGFEIGPTVSEISGANASAIAAAASETAAAASAVTASQWATKITGQVAATDYSAKAWAIGGTGVTDTASAGASKEWAIETASTVDGTDYSAKEYAKGTQASTGGSSKNWAQQTGADVTGAAANSRSAKSWSQDDNTGATLGGSAKDWAQNVSVPIDGSSGYSSKEWATGTQIRGAASGGSAKDWATYTSGTVDNSEYSAKKHAQDSAASAASSAVYAAASLWQDISYKTFADSPVSIVDADAGKLFSIDCTGGNVVVNLPAISGLSLSGPWSSGFLKSDSSANTITINRNGTDTIAGATSKVLSSQKQGATLIPDIDNTPDDWAALDFGADPTKAPIASPTFTGTVTLPATITGASAQVLTFPTTTGNLALNPMTTGGDVIYGGASGVPTRLANGTSGQVLQSNGTTVAPSWTSTVPHSLTLLTASSAQKTPTASGNWSNMTSNSVDLTIGAWELVSSAIFSNSGAVGYAVKGFGIYGADGADSAVNPTALSVTPNLTVNSVYAADLGLISEINDTGQTSVITAPPIIVTVTATVTVYVVPFATMTTPANARINTYLTAKRIY